MNHQEQVQRHIDEVNTAEPGTGLILAILAVAMQLAIANDNGLSVWAKVDQA